MTLYAFLSGAVTAGFLIASLFFLRFWKDTRDRLFLSFALAFMLLGLHQVLLVITDIPIEERSPLYLLRLIAFAMIIWSIIQKSRRN
jgi:uncharacterized membrane protein